MPRRNTVLSIGECMIEMSQSSDGSYCMGYAGDAFNTAWYLRRLFRDNWRVSFLTGVGDDKLSAEMLQFFQREGLLTNNVWRFANRGVGLYMIHLDKGERSFSYWRKASAARLLANNPDRLHKAMRDTDVIYFSGITVAILPPSGRKTLFAEIERARAKGSLIVFDPNLRPKLWHDMSTMRAEITRAAGVADIIMPSLNDELSCFDDTNAQDTLQRYKNAGANLVVLKNGSSEILATGPNRETYSLQPAAIRVPVDTTAAGDAFNAGFLSAYLDGSDIPRSLEKAAAVAGRVVGGHGALVEI